MNDILEMASQGSGGELPPWLIATAVPGGPILHGIDLVRIDAGQVQFGQISALRKLQRQATMLDLPGPLVARDSNPITTTEWLVFAATEGFEWIHLRGVRDLSQVEMAREFLHESTRLSVHISSVETIGQDLDQIVPEVDGIVLDGASLQRELGPQSVSEFLRYAFYVGERHGVPAFLEVPVGPSPTESPLALASALREGCSGLVLVPGSDEEAPMQQWIDDLMAAILGGINLRPTQTSDGRPAARLGGRQSPLVEL